MVLGLQMEEEGVVFHPASGAQLEEEERPVPGGPGAQPRRRASFSPPRGVVSTPEAWARLSQFQVE